ncbi:MAG TPA: class II aldolase/adducin family protein [Synergistales bacterium]|nr:class II aldolase/adducin family protein [Synergistales bacterium]
MEFVNIRKDIILFGRKLVERKLTVGTGGNLSFFVRDRDIVLVTPSGIDYFDMEPRDIVMTSPEGNMINSSRKPTTELDLHLALYRLRPDIQAVIHSHSVFATTVACLGWEIPAFSYLVALIGDRVPLAPYCTFGSRALAEKVSSSLGSYNGILMENHGQIAVGKDLSHAFNVAETIEFLSELYWRSRCVGMPALLEDDEIRRVMDKFRNYGQYGNPQE